MMGALQSFAQEIAPEDYGLIPGSELITNASQLSSNASDESEGTHIEYLIDGKIGTFWHSDWHGKVSGSNNHYVQIALPEALDGFYAFVIGRRNNSTTCHPTKFLIEESVDGKSWREIKTVEIPYAGQGEYCVSDVFRMKGARHLRLTCKETSTNTTTWHAAELQVYQATDEVGVEAMVYDLLTKYDLYYYGDLTLDMGTAFGQYNDFEAYKAFMDGLVEVEKYADGDIELSVAEIKQLVDNVEEYYAAIMASRVSFSMPDGYYRIMTNLRYYTDEETGEIDLDGNPVSERSYYDAAMYSTLDEKCMWGRLDPKDPRQLWRLEMVGKSIRMVNAATGMQCNGMKDGGIVMSQEADTLMAFDYVGQEDGHDIFYIRYASVPAESNIYFHQWYHGKGSGTGHQLCTWRGTFDMGDPYDSDKGTSEWYIEPVGDNEAQQLLDAFALVKDHDKMVLNYQETMSRAESLLEKAHDERNIWQPATEQPIILETSQFHSLWTEPKEGSLDNLLDGDSKTFWHSAWSDGKATGPHQASLDVEFAEPISGDYILYILRRETQDNHVTKLSLYGTNDEENLFDAEDTNWQLINSAILTPWSNGQKDVYSQRFTIPTGYRFLRFYEEDANGQNNYHYTNCAHYATFQLYPAQKVWPSQFETMGDVSARLQAIADAYPTMDMQALTLEQYQELQSALAAFSDLFVDPAELRNAISSHKLYPEYVVLGENPGYWTSDAAAKTMQATLDAAIAYDHAGRYTQAESDRFVQDIKAAAESIFQGVLPVSTDKWYHFRFDSEEHFEQYGWPTSSATNIGLLYDQLIGIGVRPDGANATILSDEEIAPNAQLFYFDNDQVDEDSRATQFRFIHLTDSTYAVQNRASGLFIYRNPLSENGGISMQNTPSAFTIKPIGYGQNIFYMTEINGARVSYPHLNAWNNVNSIVGTWDDSNPGCNSHLLIEPVEDIDLSDFAPEATIRRLLGDITPICLPYDVNVLNANPFEPIGCFEKNGESFLALREQMGDNSVEAGTPFFIIDGEEYDGESDFDLLISMGNNMTATPAEKAGVVGTFVKTWLGTGYVVFEGDKTKSVEGIDTGRNYNVPANSAYLRFGQQMISPDDEYDIAIQINGTYQSFEDGIRQTLGTLAHARGIYSLDGHLINPNGTLRNIKSLPRGTYIIGGVKVIKQQ